MSRLHQDNSTDTSIVDPRWHDLYRIGGIFCILSLVIVVLAVIAFFIWPYSPGASSTADTFAKIQNSRLGGMMSLDFFFLVGNLCSILILLPLYGALRRVNESYALVALALGLVGVISLIPSRPIAEILSLSDLYSAAATEAERSRYLAAGDALLALFNGTAWIVNIFLVAASYLISAFLMLRSQIFNKATAYVGLIANAAACGFLIPKVGLLLLLLATFGGIIWLVQLTLGFLLLEKQTSRPASLKQPAT